MKRDCLNQHWVRMLQCDESRRWLRVDRVCQLHLCWSEPPVLSLSECHALGQSQISHLWARGLLAPGPVSSKRTWTRARIWDENTLVLTVFTISLINLHTMLIFHRNDSFMLALSGSISWLNTAHSLCSPVTRHRCPEDHDEGSWSTFMSLASIGFSLMSFFLT